MKKIEAVETNIIITYDDFDDDAGYEGGEDDVIEAVLGDLCLEQQLQLRHLGDGWVGGWVIGWVGG